MRRLECLDGLRGVLAFYVLLSHMAPFAAVPHWVGQSLSHGEAAVDGSCSTRLQDGAAA